MGQKNNAICDYLEKPDKFADFVNGSLYQGRGVIKPEQIEENQTVYSGEGKTRDILRKVCRGGSYLLIGVENQEAVHYAMPVRCMEYDVLEYKKQLKKLQAKYRKTKGETGHGLSGAEFLSGMKKEDRLDPVVTIVFYHGTEEYDGCRTLRDMLSLGKENEIFGQYISDYHINLITLKELEEENFQTGVRELVGILKRRKSKEALQKYCRENEERMRELDEETFDTINIMIDREELLKQKECYKEGEKLNMCKAMEDWKEELLKEGLEQGIRGLITYYLEEGGSESEIMEKLQKIFSLDEETARNYFEMYRK